MIEAKVVAHSVAHDDHGNHGPELFTLAIKYPRFIHSEFMTHRVFSRNAASSRAIPVSKMIEQVRNDPAMPIYWGSNKPGMQAGEELVDNDLAMVKNLWLDAAENAAATAEKMQELGLHKQVANRVLEPFQIMQTVVTATEWDNYFMLRISEFAQPEIKALAVAMKEAMDSSTPRQTPYGEYHVPFVTDEERDEFKARKDWKTLCLVASARCARVSYLNHDGTNPDIAKDIELATKLKDAYHASPFEHVARPLDLLDIQGVNRNFKEWAQFRAELGL
jgi:hypothetical protein